MRPPTGKSLVAGVEQLSGNDISARNITHMDDSLLSEAPGEYLSSILRPTVRDLNKLLSPLRLSGRRFVD